jgi:hypothetical protein
MAGLARREIAEPVDAALSLYVDSGPRTRFEVCRFSVALMADVAVLALDAVRVAFEAFCHRRATAGSDPAVVTSVAG